APVPDPAPSRTEVSTASPTKALPRKKFAAAPVATPSPTPDPAPAPDPAPGPAPTAETERAHPPAFVPIARPKTTAASPDALSASALFGDANQKRLAGDRAGAVA